MTASVTTEQVVSDLEAAGDIVDRFLSDDDRQALRLARMQGFLVRMELIELRHFLGYPDEMPGNYVDAVWRVIVLRLARSLR